MNFSVSPKKGLLFISIFAIFLSSGFYLTYENSGEFICVIISIAFILLSVYLFFHTLLFRMDVSGRTISVRSWLGHRYQFTLWDIEHMQFVTHQGKGSTTHQLRIRVAGRTVYVDSTLLNFDMLMEHFMKMYEERQFKPEALPVSVANTMYLYRWQAEEASNNPTE